MIRKQTEYLLNFLIVLVILLCVAFCSFYVMKENARAEATQKANIAYVKAHCKHVGFYGKHGEYKTYECNGKLYKESDF